MTPTERTLKDLRRLGYTATVVERWNPHARIRQDLFGFIDILALHDGDTLAVQACSGGDVSKRVAKITNHENLAAVRRAGWRIEVWGWRKLKSGWEPRIVDLS
jgi:hypothetical protein